MRQLGVHRVGPVLRSDEHGAGEQADVGVGVQDLLGPAQRVRGPPGVVVAERDIGGADPLTGPGWSAVASAQEAPVDSAV